MNTNLMNVRIKLYNVVDGQNEDGDIIEGIKENEFSCWAEVSKSTVKEFRRSYKSKQSELNLNELNEVFIIRYQLLDKISNTMKIEFDNVQYEIIKIEPDHARKEHILISAKAVR